MNEMGIQPTYNLADRDGGMNQWFWIIVLFLFFGRGFGADQGVQDNFISSEFIKRDIFGLQESTSAGLCQTQKEIIENRYTNQLGLQNLGQQMSNCCCETNRNIDSVRAEAYRNTCEITTAIHAEGEATRALINANTMQALRDTIAERDRELLAANLTLQNNAQTRTIIDQLQPVPKPAYLTCSPYFAYNCGGCNGFNV